MSSEKPQSDVATVASMMELNDHIEELETAINAFLGAYEHGRKEHVKETVEDLRRLINE